MFIMLNKFKEQLQNIIKEYKMMTLKEYIFEGNQSHKMVEFAKKYYKNWESDLKQIRIKFEKSINDKELMKNDFEKYLDNQFKAMDEFNNKTLELVDKPEVAISALLYNISFLKSTQTNLFKYGIKAIKHLIELKKNNNYEGNINKYISDLCNRTVKNIQKTVDDLNQTIKDIKNEDIHSLHNIFNDEFLKSFIDKYKLIGIKYTNKFEIYDEKMVLNLFKKKYKEYINNQKIKEYKMMTLKDYIIESLNYKKINLNYEKH